jgi:large subunit ribosomal protein L4
MQYALLTGSDLQATDLVLRDDIFALSPLRPDIIARVVQWQLDKRRSGCHKTKGISDIQGTTRKPYKQKGTGNARQGSLRSPQFRGGATIFGPVVRDHGYSLNKKIRVLGLKHALSSKCNDRSLIVVDQYPAFEKAKDASAWAKKLGLVKPLFIVNQADMDAPFVRALRNLKDVRLLALEGLNVYSLLQARHVVITVAAKEAIEQRFAL